MNLKMKELIEVLTKTDFWNAFRCFGSANKCPFAIEEDRFCPLKESCIQRFAEIIGFKEDECDWDVEGLKRTYMKEADAE